MTQAQYERMLAYMRACVGDPSHGEDHVMRVTNAATKIAGGMTNVNREALLCACVLHDIGRREQLEDHTKHHAAVGAVKAKAYLIENGWDEAFSAFVGDIISAHSSAKMCAERSVEAKILFDADKLDVIGAIGVCRTVAYGVETGESIYSAGDFDGKGEESILTELQNDLEFAESSFFTDRGRELAKEKIRVSRMLIEALRAEMQYGKRFPTLSEAKAE